MNHLSKAKSVTSANKSENNGGISSSPSSPFTKINDSPATKFGKEKTIRVFKFLVDGEIICLVLTDCYDLKSWLEYGELLAGKGNFHPNKVAYVANLLRLTFPGNVYVHDQVQAAVERILRVELMAGTKPMTFVPLIDHPMISSESLNTLVNFLQENLQGKPVPNSNAKFNILVKDVVLTDDNVECFSIFMVNVLPTEIAGHLVHNLQDPMYHYGHANTSVLSTSTVSSAVTSVLSTSVSSSFTVGLIVNTKLYILTIYFYEIE